MASSSPAQTETPQLKEHPAAPHRRRRRRLLLLAGALVLIIGAIAGQVLYTNQQNSISVGRPLASPQTHLHTVAMSSQPGVVYLGTHLGLFTSTDGGRTWPQRQGELPHSMITSIAISPTNPDLLAVASVPNGSTGGQLGVYVSADGGRHWRSTRPAGLSSSASYPYSIQSAPGATGHFYAFFTFEGGFETRDLGRHWQPITHGQLSTIQTPSLLVDPAHPGHLLLGGDQGLFETQNDGKTWQQIPQVQGAVTAFVVVPGAAGQPETILCATTQGLYRRQGAGDFTAFKTVPLFSLPTRMVSSADGSALYALSGAALWFSADRGASWVRRWHFARSDLTALVVDPHDSQEVLAGFFWPGLVLISTNAGRAFRILTD